MFEHLQQHLTAATARQRLWLAWAAAGAATQACLPALHGAWTAVGPLAVWLWLLPLAALALELVWAPDRRLDEAAGGRRRGRPRPSVRLTLNRRDRARGPLRPAVRPVRRAG